MPSLCLPFRRFCRFHCRVFHFLMPGRGYFLCILIPAAAGVRPDSSLCTCWGFCDRTPICMRMSRFLWLWYPQRRDTLLCFQNRSTYSAATSLCLPFRRLCRLCRWVYYFLVACCRYFLCIFIPTAAGVRPDSWFCTRRFFRHSTLILVLMFRLFWLR